MPGPRTWGRRRPRCCASCPSADVDVIERCSGHGGSLGVKKENFAVALKVGRPAARQAAKDDKAYLASECPLAGAPSSARRRRRSRATTAPPETLHPIELMARAYGLLAGDRSMTTQTAAKRLITRADIIDPGQYAKATARTQAAQSPSSSATAASRSVRSPPSTSRTTTRCGIRSTRCCTSSTAARRRSPTSSKPITR